MAKGCGMKIYIVFDPLLEKVSSIHRTKEGASARSLIKNDLDDRWEKNYAHLFCVEEYELED